MEKHYLGLRIKLTWLKWKKKKCHLGIWMTGGKNQNFVMKRIALSMSIMSVVSLLSSCEVIEEMVTGKLDKDEPDKDEVITCYVEPEAMITDRYDESCAVEINQTTYGIRFSYGEISMDMDNNILVYSFRESEDIKDISDEEMTIKFVDIDNHLVLDTQVITPKLAEDGRWTLTFDLSNIEYDETLYYGIVVNEDDNTFNDIIYVEN